MENKVLITMCLILSIASIILSVYSISLYGNVNGTNPINISESNIKSLVGTYKGKVGSNDVIMELFEDSTMLFMNGTRGKWHVEGSEVVFEYEMTSSIWDEKLITDDNGNPKEETRIVQNRASILEKGLLFGSSFYEKL